MSSFSGKLHSSRGSVLIVALLFAAIIAISLASYISLGNNSLKQASRSFYASSGVNLAETGLELAIARFNQLAVSAPAVAWDGWTLDSTPYDSSTSPFTPAATRTFTGFSPGPGATATIKIFAQHYPGISPTTPAPKIVAQTIITQDNAPPIQKYIEVILRKRTLFGSGVTSILDVTSTGGSISIKSWDSDPDNNPATAAIPYIGSNKTANATVASTQGNIALGGGTHVEGWATVSPTHTIDAIVHDLGETVDDPDRKSYDYDATFSMEPAPSYSSNIMTADVVNTTLFPRAGDFSVSVAGKDVYYYAFSSSLKIQLGGSDHINIEAGKNVVFVLDNPGDSISTTGSSYLQIATGATFTIYTKGNVALGGGGLLNDNFTASTFRLYGTNPIPWDTTGSQTIKISGSSEFRGVIYAPNGRVEIKGGGSDGRFIGAVVGRRIHFTGNTEFVFDEQINDLTKPNYGIAQWKELQTQAERELYSSPLNF